MGPQGADRLGELFHRAAPAVHDTVADHEQGLSGPQHSPYIGPLLAQAQRQVVGDHALDVMPVLADHERQPMAGIGQPDVAGLQVDHGVAEGHEGAAAGEVVVEDPYALGERLRRRAIGTRGPQRRARGRGQDAGTGALAHHVTERHRGEPALDSEVVEVATDLAGRHRRGAVLPAGDRREIGRTERALYVAGALELLRVAALGAGGRAALAGDGHRDDEHDDRHRELEGLQQGARHDRAVGGEGERSPLGRAGVRRDRSDRQHLPQQPAQPDPERSQHRGTMTRNPSGMLLAPNTSAATGRATTTWARVNTRPGGRSSAGSRRNRGATRSMPAARRGPSANSWSSASFTSPVASVDRAIVTSYAVAAFTTASSSRARSRRLRSDGIFGPPDWRIKVPMAISPAAPNEEAMATGTEAYWAWFGPIRTAATARHASQSQRRGVRMPRPSASPEAGHHTAETASAGRVRTENQASRKMPMRVAGMRMTGEEGRERSVFRDSRGRAGVVSDGLALRRWTSAEVIVVTSDASCSFPREGVTLTGSRVCPPAGPDQVPVSCGLQACPRMPSTGSVGRGYGELLTWVSPQDE